MEQLPHPEHLAHLHRFVQGPFLVSHHEAHGSSGGSFGHAALKRFDYEAGDIMVVENGCVHQHFNASDDEDLVLLVMKAKPLFLFMHMLFQKIAKYPPKEAVPGWEDWTPPKDV